MAVIQGLNSEIYWKPTTGSNYVFLGDSDSIMSTAFNPSQTIADNAVSSGKTRKFFKYSNNVIAFEILSNTTLYGATDVISTANAGTKIDFHYRPERKTGSPQIEGEGFFQINGDQGSASDVNKFSGNIAVDGAVTITTQ